MNIEAFLNPITELLTTVGGKIIFAILVLIIGKIVIGTILKILTKSKVLDKVEGEVKTFFLSFARMGLYILLFVMIISILGVPMASVITVLASAGVAVGLALQGALSNLAGGIMLMVFRPFKVGDYIDAAGESGTVKEITLFYSTLMTVDNKRITIPNGTLMNANVTNYSTEPTRRVDLSFSVARSENPANIQDIILKTIALNDKVLDTPDAPFARLCGGTNESMEFAVRVWVNSADYWDVYFNLTQGITEALGAAGVQAPAMSIIHK